MNPDEFKSIFKNKVIIADDKIENAYNGMKFIFDDSEYTFILKGDVNSDGKITVSDARIVLRISAKLENSDVIAKESADIDSNGDVSVWDARRTLRFASRLQKTI